MQPFHVFASVLSVGLAGLAAQAPSATTQRPRLAEGLRRIGRAELLQHAGVLAADDMRGRMTATEEQQRAAEYIAAHFKEVGLEPGGDLGEDGKRSFLQRYPVRRTSVTDNSGFKVGTESLGTNYAVLPWRGEDAVSLTGPMVLVEGSPRDEDLSGKVPLLLLKTNSGKGLEIQQQFAFSFFLLQRISRTARAVDKAGAEVLVVGLLDDEAAIASVLNYMSAAPGKPIVKPAPELADLVGEGNDMGALAGKGPVPVVFTSAKTTAALLQHLGTTTDAARAWVFDGQRRPATEPAPVSVHVELVEEIVDATNVAGVLRGSDPALAGEAVVYSAHMDHVGQRLDGDVFNGADDNASGTAGLLTLASAFAAAEERPRRSVIFLAVSGEELGLWGSAWYANHPTWDGDLVANVNIDMIGRGGPDAALGQVMLTPSHRHTKYSSMARAAAEAAQSIGLELVAEDKFYARSDHINFINKGIPAVFFCAGGEHEDYHQVSDHVDRLDGEQMEKVARLAFHVGWSVANSEQRPQVIGRRRTWLESEEQAAERR